jgi:exodeoxyribonuclease III
MKIVTWNVNGLRAAMNKGFRDFFDQMDADIFCIQETKMQPEQVDFSFPGYHAYYNSAVKKGYSSTALLTKREPINVVFDLGIEEHDQEGRVILAEYEHYMVVCCYTPNAQDQLARLTYRLKFEDDFRAYLLKQSKPLILCGDLNVAHQPIDLKNPKSNTGSPGFSPQEREKFTVLLDHGFVDAYRYLYPEKIEYTWWSYFRNARATNAGWRIDYFVVSESLKTKIRDVKILGEVFGSDHCPVLMEIDV